MVKIQISKKQFQIHNFHIITRTFHTHIKLKTLHNIFKTLTTI
jgi:hypothetical protein